MINSELNEPEWLQNAINMMQINDKDQEEEQEPAVLLSPRLQLEQVGQKNC